MNDNNTLKNLQNCLHDGVSPYTQLGVSGLKKLVESLPENMLDVAQQKLMFQCYINMQKAHENVEQLIHASLQDLQSKDLFFPHITSIANILKPHTIFLEGDISPMPTLTSKRLGICAFELVNNQIKHNHFQKCLIHVTDKGALTELTLTFLGAKPFKTRSTKGLGLKLLTHRVRVWGGSLNNIYHTLEKTLVWTLQLPKTGYKE